MSEKKKNQSVLVIGSTGYKNAEKCIEWGNDIYVPDYDVVVVDTTTLTKEIMEQIVQKKGANYFDELNSTILEAQVRNNLRIVCIISEYITTKYSDRYQERLSNYSWSPIIPIFEERPGEKIDNKQTCTSLTYFKYIKNWERLCDGSFNNNTPYDGKINTHYELRASFNKKVANKINKAVAFEFCWNLHKEHSSLKGTFLKAVDGGSVLFIPPIKNIKKEIDLLLEEYLCLEESRPSWVDDIVLPQEDQILSKIKIIDNDISVLEKRKEEEKNLLSGIDKYKKLAYLNGKPLETIIDDSLALLGINLVMPDTDNIEDRLFIDDGRYIYIEIRGANRGMNEKDLAQLITRITDKPIPQNYKTRGVFVFNHYNKKPPEERDEPFHHNIIEKADVFSLCLITTLDILELVKLVLSGQEIVDFEKELFNTTGKFDIEKFKKEIQKQAC